MKRNWIIIWIALGVLIFAVVAYFLFVGNSSNSFSCIQAGEVYENPSLGPEGNFGECCPGLVGIGDEMNFDENCDYSGLLGGGKFCSDCGNGICEEWESKCNCAVDCS